MDADLIALLERVKNGNDKLWAAWRVIRNVPDPEEKADLFLKWDGRVNFLNLLCKELIVKGYNECLYIENGIKTKSCLNNPDEPEWFCNTCPAAIGGAKKYAERELMALPSSWRGCKVDGAEQMKFLKTLGGKRDEQ